MNVTVIGAGTMGNGIAHVFAQSGHAVTLVDLDRDRLDAALATIGKNLGRQVKKEKITAEEQEATLGRITPQTDLAEGVAAADLVVEAATENAELKAQIFQALDDHAPEAAILASNTSSISITQIAGALAELLDDLADAELDPSLSDVPEPLLTLVACNLMLTIPVALLDGLPGRVKQIC